MFTVSVRRKGKFKPIGVFGSASQAFRVGKSRVGGTLAATFKVSGPATLRTPSGFYTKKTREGTLFIEQRKYRLSTGTEKREIKLYGRKKK